MEKNITSRKDGVTKDIAPSEEAEQTFSFPTLGVSVQAKSMNEALIKAKEAVKSNNK